jgi:PIN domain nuclease of toxin-antitoxin system
MMQLLLDTQGFLWMDSSADQLSERARQVIVRTDNQLYLSIASTWEMQIKQQLGKLKLRLDLVTIIDE